MDHHEEHEEHEGRAFKDISHRVIGCASEHPRQAYGLPPALKLWREQSADKTEDDSYSSVWCAREARTSERTMRARCLSPIRSASQPSATARPSTSSAASGW